MIKTFIIIALITSIINFTDIFIGKVSFVPDKETAQSSIKISLVNVKTENTSYEKLNKLMENENPDIILLEEINTTWLENIDYIRKNYSYKIEHPRDDNFGIALYSKLPLNNLKIEKWTDWQTPVITCDIVINSKRIKFVGIHTLPPIKSYIDKRNSMLKQLNQIITDNPENLIILGDLNTTKYSFAYKKYIAKTKIKNINDGQWISGSWPSHFPPFARINIDYILFTKNLSMQKSYKGKNIGSDHLPVFGVINLID